MKWSPKDPEDTRDYAIDWEPFLPAGETITDALITAPDGLTIVSQAFTDTTVTARFSDGVAGTSYNVDCTVTTSSGQIFDVTIVLKVAERIVK